MNLNLGELESLFSKIQDIIDRVEQTRVGKRQELYLSSGDKLIYSLYKENIPHLLGINIDYLKSTGHFSGNNTYDIFKDFISNAYRVNCLLRDGFLNYDQIFSEFTFKKIDNFINNINLNIFDTEFICKYDSTKTYSLTDKNQKFDYIIVKKNKDSESYSMLCLVKNDYIYVPMSNMYFEDYESLSIKLKELIPNQEVTIFSGMKRDMDNYYKLPMDVKITKLTNLQKYKNEFSCIIDTNADFKYLLTDSLKHKNQFYDNGSLLTILTDSIGQGHIIDVEPFVDSYLLRIVNAYNDYLCSHNIENSEIEESYSKILEDRKNLIEELNIFKDQVKTLKEEKEV